LAIAALSGIVPTDMATSDDDDKGTDAGDERGAAGDDRSPDEGAEESSTTGPASEKPAARSAPATGSAPKREPPRAPPTAGLGKSVTLFIIVVGGISLLMLLLGTEKGGGGASPPKWEEGKSYDIDITLVSTDKQDLACASGTEIKGLHCGFESQARRWSKGDANDDKKMLRPYSTTNGIQFFAAGLWSEPALAPDKLPATRFSVKCKLNVAGKMPRADVRWHEGEGWNNVSDWFAGSVADCKLGTVQQ
jgi:hypothetical protein